MSYRDCENCAHNATSGDDGPCATCSDVGRSNWSDVWEFVATLTAELAATRQTIERVEAIPERWAEVIDATMADAMRTPSTTADKAMAGGICEVIRCCANELRAALETPEGENDGEVDK